MIASVLGDVAASGLGANTFRRLHLRRMVSKAASAHVHTGSTMVRYRGRLASDGGENASFQYSAAQQSHRRDGLFLTLSDGTPILLHVSDPNSNHRP